MDAKNRTYIKPFYSSIERNTSSFVYGEGFSSSLQLSRKVKLFATIGFTCRTLNTNLNIVISCLKDKGISKLIMISQNLVYSKSV